MSLKARIQSDITAYMKAGDTTKRDTLRLVLGEIQSAEKSGKAPKEFSDTELEAFLGKQVKTRRASAEIYTDANESERASKETAEADLLETYLPAPMTEADVLALVEAEIAKLEDPSIKQKGTVMKAVNAEVKGRFPGKVINDMVTSRLS
jgi:uncharacterized protein YqeY